MSGSEVTVSIDLPAPPKEVWDLVMDPQRLGDWVTIHKELRRHDAVPPRTGATMEQVLVLRGAPFKVTWKLVTCEEGARAEWHGRGPARSHAETEYLLTEIDGGKGTRFSYRNDFKAPLGPLGSIASKALVGGVPEREARASLDRLKKLLTA
ncbi:SRPBCC family protein [Paraconexibacter sp.]|uniref:SRPBCC family protein n=1 Tax=Paraconexibacter sp. TaxID=2949640 RepID=UPI0035634A0C